MKQWVATGGNFHCSYWVYMYISKFVHWSSISLIVLVGGCLQDWFPLTELPWNLPAVPGIIAEPIPTFGGTSSQAHELAMSLAMSSIGLVHTKKKKWKRSSLTLAAVKVIIIVFFFFALASSLSYWWNKFTSCYILLVYQKRNKGFLLILFETGNQDPETEECVFYWQQKMFSKVIESIF